MDRIKNMIITLLLLIMMSILIYILPKFIVFMEGQDDILNIIPENQTFIINVSNSNYDTNINKINITQNVPAPKEILEKNLKEYQEKKRIEAENAEKERLRQEQLKIEEAKKLEVAKQNVQKVTSRSSAELRNNSEYIKFTATGYCPCSQCCGKSNGMTASGNKAKAGVTVAMPSNYSFGTKIEIKGMGTYIVQDRGGAIKGNKIDIFFNTHQEALNFGRKTVYIKIL